MAVQSQTYVKKRNTLMVLNLIAQGGDVSRTQISEATELSPASVTRIVNMLTGLGLVRELGKAESAKRGRKARFLQTCADGLYTVGFCIEQRVLLMSVSDYHHHIIWRAERELDEQYHYSAEELAHLAGELFAGNKESAMPDISRIRAAGVSVAGLVDNRQGVVLRSDQMRWNQADLRTPFQNTLGMPVWIENDAKACLIGERARFLSRQEEEMAYLLIGSGIGVAATCDGQVIRGFENEAGEVEHVNLLPSFTQRDTLKAHLLEECILRNARAAAPSIQTLEDLAAAYHQGLLFARFQIEDFERYLRFLLSMIVCFYDPERIVMGGSTILKLAPLLGSLWEDPRFVLGDGYEISCLLGASIGAEKYALDLLLE